MSIREVTNDIAAEEQAVADFNAAHPIGTAVRYWKGVRPHDDSGGFDAKTRSAASMSGDTAVVFVEGQGGGIALSHVKPL